MFAGDETGGVVLDVGHFSTKAGYAGDDVPRCVLPSTMATWEEHERDGDIEMVGRSSHAASVASASSSSPAGERSKAKRRFAIGDSALSLPRAGADLVCPMRDGHVEDWEALEAMWSRSLAELRMDPRTTPLLVVEPILLPQPQRERMVELLFESLQVPATYLAKASTCAAFSAGLATATVVDLGYEHTRVAAVYDGYQMSKSAQQSPVGQRALDAMALALLDAKAGRAVRPRIAIRTSVARDGSGSRLVSDVSLAGFSDSYAQWGRDQVGRDAKETIVMIPPFPYVEGLVEVEDEEYTLPDGSVLSIGAERALMGESIFIPDVAIRAVTGGFPAILRGLALRGRSEHVPAAVGAGAASASTSESAADPLLEGLQGADPQAVYEPNMRLKLLRATSATGAIVDTLPVATGLHRLVSAALHLSDAETRKTLVNNVLLVGGGSLLSGLADRLQTELSAMTSAAFKPRVVSGASIERQFAPWIGGSILSSLGTFQELWVSKQEYDEEGPGLVERRCG